MESFQELCKNNFKTVSKLARGGQKVVYEGEHNKYGDCVVKLYFQLDDPRSLREVEIENKLDLPMIPKIYENGIIEFEGEKTMYIIEEKIHGAELRKLFESGMRFNLKDAVDFLEQGLGFIQCLEKERIVHRDIKPENIIRTENGRIYFLDFGIARILGAQSLTNTKAIMGPHTAGYAAPEQFNNLKNSIDSRADIFSLGVVTYEGITGFNPFREGASSYLEVLQNTETISPVQYSIQGDTQSQLMALLSAMMGKFPSRRPNSAEEALGWLEAAKETFVYE